MMKRIMDEKAYAKINLGLDVLRKREDGYHQLKTGMQTVSLADELTIEVGGEPGIRIFCNRPELPADRRNLAYQAAETFLSCAELNIGLQIRIRKHIPAAAGLAGGSADAAAVFRALNTLFDRPFSGGELQNMARPLGADIPFCICGGTCLAGGIGEQLTILPELAPCRIVIAKPVFDLSTAFIYGNLHADQLPEDVHPDMDRIVNVICEGNLERLRGILGNVLERPAREAYPQIEACKQALLLRGAIASSMSGSGSAVFGVFAEEEQALCCIDSLEQDRQRLGLSEIFLTKPVSRLLESGTMGIT